VNEHPEHLTDAQIEGYIQHGSGGPPQMDAHLFECDSCLNRMLDSQRAQFGLLRSVSMNQERHPDCPDEDIIRRLAAGIYSDEDADYLIQHIAVCEYCGPLLKQYREDFSDETDPVEQDLLRGLKSSTPGWQKDVVRKHFEGGLGLRLIQGLKRFFTFSPGMGAWRWASAGAGLAAVIVVGVIAGPTILTGYNLSKTSRLVAKAYQQHRTTDMRLTSVDHGPYIEPSTQMGSGEQETEDIPSALYEAKSTLANEKQRLKSGDPQWLAQEGRVFLLQRDSGKAVNSLKKAHSASPDDPAIAIDLAAGYFEQESRNDHPSLLATFELLQNVLKNPKLTRDQRSSALFDLAVAHEKTEGWGLAVETWKEYLQNDSSGPWAQEAQARLDRAKTHIPAPRPQAYANPSFFLSRLTEFTRPEDDEIYQSIAVRFWLPKAVGNPASDFAQASQQLAGRMTERHGDPWLKDLLAASSPASQEATRAMSNAVESNQKGLYKDALAQAQTATAAFSQAHNLPGELRASYEEVYAHQRLMEGEGCLDLANRLEQRLSETKYRWLQAQLSLERATCLNWKGNLEGAKEAVDAAGKIVAASWFPMLNLRIMGHTAGIDLWQGRTEEAYRASVQGVASYWKGSYPVYWLYQFYSLMEICAEKNNSWHLAEALQRHAIDLLANTATEDRDAVLEGLAHATLGNILFAEHEDSLSENEIHTAISKWEEAPGEPSAVKYRFVNEIGLAENRLRRGKPELALQALETARPLLPTIQASYVTGDYYKVLGNAYWTLGRLIEAQGAYEEGIRTVEEALSTETDESRRLRWVTASDESYRGLAHVLLKEKKPAEAWELWEWYRSRSQTSTDANLLRGSARKVAWSELQPKIFRPLTHTSPETRLVYAVFDDGLQIWTVNNGALSGKWVDIQRDELQKIVQEFATECATEGSDLQELRRNGQKLEAILLAPVISELPSSRTIVVELDEGLTHLPLLALVDPTGKYFGEQYTLVHSPGILLEDNLRLLPQIEASDASLIVDASQSNGIGNLPGHELERTSISSFFAHTRTLNGTEAAGPEFAPALSRSNLLVYIGHGIQTRTGTELVLCAHGINSCPSDGHDAITARDFSPPVLKHLKLVVLEACSSGVAKSEYGLLDTGGLVHSLLSGGVPFVVASDWNVDSKRTAQLTARFFEHLGKGEGPPQAMLDARHDMIAEAQHPYFWAGFDVYGRAN